MAHIQILDTHVAELIAAGEVVERPASVVKELVENSIDAHSTRIDVAIERGGMRSISISDNGCGIAPDELPSAFLRHATSKVRSAADLGQIETLGFRGEALAAICAVSRVEVRTREAGAVTGSRLELEGGTCGTVEDVGVPEGTSIIVRDLFYNTPARLKFMRKDTAETAAIHGLIQHLALSRPDISFRFRKDGADAFQTPGDGNLLSAIYAAYGREFARSLLAVEGHGGEIALSGYVTFPAFGRGSRAMQMFFLNGRYIKSTLLTAALEEAYKNQMLKGKFPGCVLSVTMPAHMVDVNVHPAKTEVKFANEQELFRTVYHTILDALNAKGAPTNMPLADAGGKPGFYRTMDAGTYRAEYAAKSASGGKALGTVNRFEDTNQGTVNRFEDANQGTVNRFEDANQGTVNRLKQDTAANQTAVTGTGIDRDAGYAGTAGTAVSVPRHSPDTEPEAQTPDTTAEAEPEVRTPDTGADVVQPGAETLNGQRNLFPEARTSPWRIVGELLCTYIVCESAEGDVYLIDKHAAHERVKFDALKAGQTPPMRQTLLQAVTVQLSKEDAVILLEHLETLEGLGFGCEDFGGNTLLVREIPSDLDVGDVTSTLEALAEDLRTGHSSDERRDAMFRTMACKSAIRGDAESTPQELRVLVDKVQNEEIRYCPHGRPVAIRITKVNLEKLFKRV